MRGNRYGAHKYRLMARGDTFTLAPPTTATDPWTGHSVRRLTDLAANDQLLYFTSSSLTADDGTLLFISDRTGQPNIFALERKSSRCVQLTDNDDGALWSYVYFDGGPTGLGKASVSLCPATGDVYYIQGTEIHRVNAHSLTHSVIGEVPVDHVTAFTHVSDDNHRLCVPTIPAESFRYNDSPKEIPDRVERLSLLSDIRVLRTDGTSHDIVHQEPGWVTHVQFRPSNPAHILFNHEWRPDSGIRRMWNWNGAKAVKLRPEGETSGARHTYPRRATDWTCHEMWERDGRAVIYHGAYTDGPAYIGRVLPNGTAHIELALPDGWERYGHFTVGNDPQTLVTDGYIELSAGPTGKARGGNWISLIHADWDAPSLAWTPLCAHGSSWGSQDAHPHPIFSHAGDEVLFTSDREGNRAVYAVEVPVN